MTEEFKIHPERVGTNFKNKNILVVGLARSGMGAANLLSSLGAQVCVTDIQSPEFLAERIKKLSPSIKVVAGHHPEELFTASDFIVVSPGVPLDMPSLKKARERGIPVIGELELAYQVIQSGVRGQGPEVKGYQTPAFIGITGTNGKSTTTTLIHLMLKKAGFRTLMAGNIGNALTEEIVRIIRETTPPLSSSACGGSPGIDQLPLDYIVTEISSFQLESIEKFRPLIALMLNLTPDHLDRYHSMEEYVDAKANIFRNQNHNDYLILNADDPVIMHLYHAKLKMQNAKLRNVKALFFSRKKEIDGVYYKNGSFFSTPLSTPGTTPSGYLRKGFVPPFQIISADEIKIKGIHNLENAMAASLTALICGCPVDVIRDVLKHFSGLEHRLEFAGEIRGVNFINDSKGTNVGAVVKSLEGLQDVILIMGGRDKDGDFTVLKELFRSRVKALVLLGEAKEKIAKAAGGITETIFVNSMEEAVAMSMAKASSGDVVLLSPGCASFDMFRDFEDRGRKFKEAVLDMKKKNKNSLECPGCKI